MDGIVSMWLEHISCHLDRDRNMEAMDRSAESRAAGKWEVLRYCRADFRTLSWCRARLQTPAMPAAQIRCRESVPHRRTNPLITGLTRQRLPFRLPLPG